MPNRIIKESICISETVDKMSWFEECFWHRLIVNCDDYGCMDARPKILKAKLFPLKDRLTIKDVEDALHKLADIGCVRLYECDSKPYLYLPSWEAHQKVRAKKRKYPDPNNVKSSEIICEQLQADVPVIQSNPIQSESNTNTDAKSAISKKQKHKYGEFKNVLLYDSDIEKLKAKFPNDWEKRIEQLSQGIELKGYSYKNHYLAILKWAERDFSSKSATQECHSFSASYDLDEYEKYSIFDDQEENNA